MKIMIRKIPVLVLTLVILLSLSIIVQAEETEAINISGAALVTELKGFPSLYKLFDHNQQESFKTENTSYLTLEHADGIGSLYLIFLKAYGPYTITDHTTGTVFTAGTNGFVHEFIDLVACFGTAPTTVTISFENGPVKLQELEAFTEGRVPDYVQKWEVPEEGKMDLILFATHSDDDQLFFAGLLPYYGVERDYEVMVAYLTDHSNTLPYRIHEALDGLWAVGVTNYPVFGGYADFYTGITLKDAFAKFESHGSTQEDMTGFVVEQLRKYKPMVAIGHDLDGEYGHIQHKVYSALLTDAVRIAGNAEHYPESAAQYGTWDVPKTYIHLYPDNQIIMDWDQPMEHFGGMTPFEVSKDLGFAAHGSQQAGWSWYFLGKKSAASVTTYSPREYGLHRTTVGPDVNKNDMFENLISHAEEDRLAEELRLAEEAQLAEEARLAEAVKLAEEERLAQLAAEARLAEESRQAEEARLAAEALQTQRNRTYIGIGCVVLVGFCIISVLFRRKKK